MSKTAKKKYLSYKEISTRYAITIPALKEHLRQAGWLVRDEAAGDGLENTDLRLGEYKGVPSRQWRWEQSAVVSLMEARGLAVPDEFQKAVYVRNVHQAAQRLIDISHKLFKLMEPDASEAEQRMLGRAYCLIQAEVHVEIIWPAQECPSTAPRLVKEAFNPFARIAQRCLAATDAKQQEVSRWLDATTAIARWLSKQKPQPVF